MLLISNIIFLCITIGTNGLMISPIKSIKYKTTFPTMQDWVNDIDTNAYTKTYTKTYSDKLPKNQDYGYPILIQGGSLRTWSYKSHNIERLQVVLSTNGRPMDSDIELWNGPDNTPFKLRVYNENGADRPFSAVIETPRGPNTVAIKNIGQIEFPITANVFSDKLDTPSSLLSNEKTTIQGGALRTYPFHPNVDSVEIFLHTDGRPLNTRIEILQGPNNNKEVIELYTDNGNERPFFCILETPGTGNVVKIVNTAPVEFPMYAAVLPHSINYNSGNDDKYDGGVVIG
jgi:hypothetical protein